MERNPFRLPKSRGNFEPTGYYTNSVSIKKIKYKTFKWEHLNLIGIRCLVPIHFGMSRVHMWLSLLMSADPKPGEIMALIRRTTVH